MSQQTTQPTPATQQWPAWVATVERDAEDGSTLAYGAERTFTIADALAADLATLALSVQPSQWRDASGAAEPAIVQVTPVQNLLPADARKVAAALIEAADQIEGTEPAAAATVTSTTGTAPLTFTATEPGLVRVDLEDGSSQVYRRADLLAALGGVR